MIIDTSVNAAGNNCRMVNATNLDELNTKQQNEINRSSIRIKQQSGKLPHVHRQLLSDLSTRKGNLTTNFDTLIDLTICLRVRFSFDKTDCQCTRTRKGIHDCLWVPNPGLFLKSSTSKLRR